MKRLGRRREGKEREEKEWGRVDRRVSDEEEKNKEKN